MDERVCKQVEMEQDGGDQWHITFSCSACGGCDPADVWG